jgi:ribosome maturation protein Sdo1
MARGKSRPVRWAEAVAEVKKHLDVIEDAKAQAIEAMQELESLRSEYEEMRDNVPENLQGSPYYEKLDAVASLDFSSEDVEEMVSVIEEAEGAELPLGFGRD